MQRFWVQSFPDPGRRRIKWRPADRVGYETRPLHRCHGKVTGATQKWVSAKVWQVSVAWKSLSAHDFALKSSAHMARQEFELEACSNEQLFSLEYPQESSNFVYRR